MKQWMLGWVLCALCGGAVAQQQVWKCEDAGQVRYSDQPCETEGRALPARGLQPNGPGASSPEALIAASAPSAGVARPERRTARARQRDPLAPMPPGFVQRGNPRAQMPGASPTP